jgi:hypothetical protein
LLRLPEKLAGALPLIKGGDGVAERNFSLRPVPTGRTRPAAPVEPDDDDEACGGESLLLDTLPRHEKAPLLLLLL